MKAKLAYFLNSTTPLNAVTIPTSSFQTVAIDLTDYNDPWMIEVYRSLTNGSVVFTVQYSMNNSNWFVLDPRLRNLALSGSIIHVPPIQSSNIFANYVRLNFTISSSPTGTITARFFRINQ
jgi:hypothetical protein